MSKGLARSYSMIGFISLITLLLISCKSETTSMKISRLEIATFGAIGDTTISKYTMTNTHGMRVSIIEYGAIVQAIEVRDKDGRMRDVVIGWDDLQGYLDDGASHGAFTGRVGNRISNARFTLDGHEYRTEANLSPHTLHSGSTGFHKQVWRAEVAEGHTYSEVILSRLCPHLEGGFPGNLHMKVIYRLTDDNELVISYQATTDQTTVINVTNHAYFNLSGEQDILDHELSIKASQITQVTPENIPDGNFYDIRDTPLDFNEPKPIGRDIDKDNPQLKIGSGYDHNYVLSDTNELKYVGRLSSPLSRIYMDTYTTEPGVQLYTGNWINIPRGKGGKSYGKRSGVCLETQHFPDSPNHPHFPSIVLRPNEEFKSRTIYQFGVL